MQLSPTKSNGLSYCAIIALLIITQFAIVISHDFKNGAFKVYLLPMSSLSLVTFLFANVVFPTNLVKNIHKIMLVDPMDQWALKVLQDDGRALG